MTSSTVLPQPLITGQRMSREEFLCRWEALPELKNAELIEGTVYVSSPVSTEHGEHDGLAAGWLSRYAWLTPGCRLALDATWNMLEDLPQPDLSLIILPQYGGQSSGGKRFRVGAPELAVEICVTSTDMDFGPKLDLYRRAEVREYITLETFKKRITWRALHKGFYQTVAPGADGNYHSRVFPGLWLNADAFWAWDEAALDRVLQQGLASPEHAAFIDQLSRRLRT